MAHVIKGVEKGSIAEELEIQAGDVLEEINGREIADVFEYRLALKSEELTLIVKRENEIFEYEIEKDEDEDLGLEFESGLMSDARECQNNCVFCFIAQLPKGLRKTLYFRDDDMRLSFLSGNYVTLTNMSDVDLDKIIAYHLSPVNISVHTTDGALRVKMLGNKNAAKIDEQINKLYVNNIDMNFQIVLCKGLNDGDGLVLTIRDLARFYPKARSLSVVPVGLTKFRDGLYPLEAFSAEDCVAVIGTVLQLQSEFLKKYGTRFVYAADEFFVKVGYPVPDLEEYEDFPQLENGVGMLALTEAEFDEQLEKVRGKEINAKKVTVVTGEAAYGFILKLAQRLSRAVNGVIIDVVEVKNNFFGKNITVSGLLTGRDIIDTLKKEAGNLGNYVLLPRNALKADEDIFLDDVTPAEVERFVGTRVKICGGSGKDFIDAVLED